MAVMNKGSTNNNQANPNEPESELQVPIHTFAMPVCVKANTDCFLKGFPDKI